MREVRTESESRYDITIEDVDSIDGTASSSGRRATIVPESVHFRTAVNSPGIRQAWVYGRKINRDGKPGRQSTNVLFVGGSGYRAAVIPAYVARLADKHGLRWPAS